MKGKILFAEYNEITGISTVTKITKYGTFTASAVVCDEDKDIANRFDGCLFAEMKCDLQAYRMRANFMRERAKGIEHAYDVLLHATQDREEDVISDDLMRLGRQADIAQDQADTALETYHILKDSYKAYVETSLRSRREIRKKSSQ